MPKPQTKMTWDNAVWISPTSAAHYGVTTGDVVTMEYLGRKVDGPDMDPAGARGRIGDGAIRLWPHARREGRQRHRL